jgi:hypothetical protein
MVLPLLNSSLNISNSFIFLICEIHVTYTNPSISFKIVMMLLILLVFAPIEYLIAVNAESGVLFSQTEKPFGKSFGDWSNKWFSWLMSMPMDKTAMKDSTGEFCAEKQNDKDVFFLAGATPGDNVVRHCKVPFGKALLFIDGNECTHGEYKDIKNEDLKALENCAIDGNRLGQQGFVTASLDGVPIKNIVSDYNVTSGPFILNITDGFPFSYDEKGSWNSMANSYVLFIKPPPKGNHELDIDVLHQSPENNIPYTIKYILSVS